MWTLFILMTNTSALLKCSVQTYSPGQGTLLEEQAMDLSGDSLDLDSDLDLDLDL